MKFLFLRKVGNDMKPVDMLKREKLTVAELYRLTAKYLGDPDDVTVCVHDGCKDIDIMLDNVLFKNIIRLKKGIKNDPVDQQVVVLSTDSKYWIIDNIGNSEGEEEEDVDVDEEDIDPIDKYIVKPEDC